MNEKEFEIKVRHPTDPNSIWLIFFAMKWCSHCKSATPGYARLKQDSSEYEKRLLRMRKIECTENEDLCNNQEKIEAYPTFRLFKNGKMIGQLPDDYDTDYAGLKRFVDEQLSKLNQTLLLDLQSIADSVVKPNPTVNPHGKIIHLTSDEFGVATNFTNWFIMFHAPWCTHCQSLGPTFEKLSPIYKQKVNIAKVDCTLYQQICKNENIQGFPTLKFYQQGQFVQEYQGDRTLQAMKQFLDGFFVKPAFIPMLTSNIKETIVKNEVCFFFLLPDTIKLDEKPELKLLTKVAVPLRNQIDFYVTMERDAFDELGIQSVSPQLVVFKDFGRQKYEYNGPLMNSIQATKSMTEWVNLHRHKLVVELETTNAHEILGSQQIVVMLIINPNDHNEASIELMRSVARSWNKDNKKTLFCWLDGIKWEQYLSRVYNYQHAKLPKLVIADPKNDVYYDKNIKGTDILLTKEEVVDSLTACFDEKLTAKYTNGSFGRFARYLKKTFKPITNFVKNHPFITILIFVGITIWIVYRLSDNSQYEAVKVE